MIYSIAGGATALSRTANFLGKTTTITKSFNLFKKSSLFTQSYTVKRGWTITKTVHLSRPWFRAVNGVGAAVDSINTAPTKIKKIYERVKETFGGDN